MRTELIIEELGTRVRLASNTPTLIVVTVPEAREADNAASIVSAILESKGIRLKPISGTQSVGPDGWARRTARQDADVFTAVFSPKTELAARTQGRLFNAERERLREMTRPLLLFMSTEDEGILRGVAPDFLTWAAQSYALPSVAELRELAPASSAAPSVALKPPAKRPIRFLHLSDVHFGTDSAKRYDQDRVLQGLLTRLEREHDSRPLDLIFFTGDLAHSGKANEYDLAVAFFEKLLMAAHLTSERLFVVPGNHDVDRGIGRWAARTLASNEMSTEFFTVEESRWVHERKFSAYSEAVSRLLGKERPAGLRVGEEAVEFVTVRDVVLAVASFNTAWFAVADDDHGKLWLGEANVDLAARRIRAEAKDALKIALLHHPISDLAESERSAVENHLERNFDLILRGHLHDSRSRSIRSGRGGYLEIAAPAAYQGSQWPNGCFIGELFGNPRFLRLTPYRFGSGADPWTVDNSVFPDDEVSGHRHDFSLPERQGGSIRGAMEVHLAGDILTALDARTARSVRVRAQGLDAPSASPLERLLGSAEPKEVIAELPPLHGSARRIVVERLAARAMDLIPAHTNTDRDKIWDKQSFETLLSRFEQYWSSSQFEWIEALGRDPITYEVVTFAFLKRCAPLSVRMDHIVQKSRENIMMRLEGSAPESTAALTVATGAHTDLIQGRKVLREYMTMANVELGAQLYFRPSRSQSGSEVLSTVDLQIILL